MKIYGHQRFIDGKKVKEVKNYKCGFCRNEFKHYVRRVVVNDQQGRGSSISTKIICPKCKNFLEMW